MGLLSSVSLIFSFFATGLSLYLYFKFARPQAELAIKQNENLRDQQLSEHRKRLKELFFEKLKNLFGNGQLNENGVFEGVKGYINGFKYIREDPGLEKYWQNGMEHLRNDDPDLQKILNSILEDMESLEKATKNLNNLAEEKVKIAIKPWPAVHKYEDLTSGKVDENALLCVIKADLLEFIYRCCQAKEDCITCLKNQIPSDLSRNSQGDIVKNQRSIAKRSLNLKEEDIRIIISTVEKDDQLLQEIINMRDMRIKLRDKFKDIADRCTTIIKKIEGYSYDTVLNCCLK